MPKLSDFDTVAKEHGQGGGDGEWYRPEEGESRVKILSDEFEVIGKHWIASQKRSFICFGKEKGCPHDSVVKDKNTGEEKTMHKVGVKYLVWLIDRKDGKIKIGELPYSVVKPIADLKTNEEYGYEDVPPYDITIKKTKTGTASTDVEYSVIPSRKDSPLTDAEMKEFSEKTPLSEIVQKMKDKEQLKHAAKSNPEEKEDEDFDVEES